MVSGTSATSSSTSAYEALVPAATSGDDGLASKDTFLKLLISQIKNQDPMNPSDGVQFLTQLTQFSQLEQTMQIRQGIDGLRQDLNNLAGVDTTASNDQ